MVVRHGFIGLKGFARLLVLAAVFQAPDLHASNAQVIESVELEYSGRSTIASVRLVCPVRVLNADQEEMSATLQIRVEAVGHCPSLEEGVVDRYRMGSGREAQLDSVLFEQDAQSAVLTLRFDEPVMFEIQNTGISRLLKVRVFQPMAIKRTLDDSNAWSAGSRYAINLESSRSRISAEQLELAQGTRGQVAYITEVTVNGAQWQRLRLGFFSTEEDAKRVLAKLQGKFPQAWVTRTTAEEVALASSKDRASGRAMAVAATPVAVAAAPVAALPSGARAAQTVSPAATSPPAPGPRVKPEADNNPAAVPDGGEGQQVGQQGVAGVVELQGQAAERMQAARQAILDQDWDLAVRLLTSVLANPESLDHPLAREYLGLARERKGQLAHAKAEYQRYLQDYPEAEGAGRVQQRLVGLVTAGQAPGSSGAGSRQAVASDSNWDAFGSIWQYYYRDVRQVGDTRRSVDSIYSNVDLLGRYDGERYGMMSRINGGYRHFLSGVEGANDGNVNLAYLEMTDRAFGVLARVGRQTRHSGGVLGRFDGAYLAYDITPDMTLNGVAGYTVASVRESMQTERTMYGVSMDFADVFPGWDFTAFYHAQDYSGITDRRAVGGEVRFFNERGNLLGLVDYDTYYGETNIALLSGNWNFPGSWVVSANLDYRRSPLITSRNALIGQQVQSMEALLAEVGEDEVRMLAADRSAEYKSAMLGISRPITEKLQIKVNASMFNLSGTESSGGVIGTPDMDNEYAYDLQFIGSSLFYQGDMSIFGMRYVDGSRYQTVSLFVNSRFPVGPSFRLQPRFRVDQRSRALDDLSEWIVRPSMRLEYRIGQQALEFEAGGELWRQDGSLSATDASAYFLNLGYRVVF